MYQPGMPSSYPPWCTPPTHPGYTHPPPLPLMYAHPLRCNGDNLLGPGRRNSLGRREKGEDAAQNCERRARTLRGVVCSLPEERTEDRIAHGRNSGKRLWDSCLRRVILFLLPLLGQLSAQHLSSFPHLRHLSAQHYYSFSFS